MCVYEQTDAMQLHSASMLCDGTGVVAAHEGVFLKLQNEVNINIKNAVWWNYNTLKSTLSKNEAKCVLSGFWYARSMFNAFTEKKTHYDAFQHVWKATEFFF